MRSISGIFVVLFILASFVSAQQRRTVRKPAVKTAAALKPVPAALPFRGSVSGRTYTNPTFNFEITFPDTWLIPGADFEAKMKAQGYDISLKPPKAASPLEQAKLNASVKNVTMLMTAYRSMPGSTENAIVRVAVEDLRTTPQVKDAVDYIDLLRQTYKFVKMPADYKYSATDAEKLGKKQFAFLDTSSSAGKTRLYATVRNGFAILFTLYYNSDEDLTTFRNILAEGNFALK